MPYVNRTSLSIPGIVTLDPTSGQIKQKYFIIQHLVKLWNSLPQDVVMATNLDGFERGLDKFLEKAINGY